MPTMGRVVREAAQETNSTPTTGSGFAFEAVPNTGPTAMQSAGDSSAASNSRGLWVETPMSAVGQKQAHVGGIEILLAHVHPVGLGHAGDVGAVVDEEQDPGLPRRRAQLTSARERLRIGETLESPLHDEGPIVAGDEPHPLGQRARPEHRGVDDRVEKRRLREGGGEAL